MSFRPERDVNALEVGFLADGVLLALRAFRRGQLGPPNVTHLRGGAGLLHALSEWTGPVSPGEPTTLQLNALNSFGYAAAAIKAGHASVTDGLRKHFAALATSLDSIVEGRTVPASQFDQLVEFFQGLSNATLDSWNATQAPTLLALRA